MSWDLKFHPEAKREWDRLDPTVRLRLEKTLLRRLQNPVVLKDRLSGNLSNNFRIRLAKEGVRLVYVVIEDQQIVFVRSIGARAGKKVYRNAVLRHLDFLD